MGLLGHAVSPLVRVFSPLVGGEIACSNNIIDCSPPTQLKLLERGVNLLFISSKYVERESMFHISKWLSSNFLRIEVLFV